MTERLRKRKKAHFHILHQSVITLNAFPLTRVDHSANDLYMYCPIGSRDISKECNASLGYHSPCKV